MNTSNVSESQLLEQVSRERLWETNSHIAQWERISGTAEEAQAFDYVQQVLQEYGLQTTRFEHPALISYPLEASLAIVDEPDNVVKEYACLGTAFSASVDQLDAEVVDLGFGTPQDYAGQDVRGKIALLNGLATPAAVYAAEQAGTIGQIFINDDHRHYMIVTSIWGTPTPESAQRLPTTTSVSVTETDGHDLRQRLSEHTIRVRLHSQIFKEWQQTPLLIGELAGRGSEDFVLFSGHLDSWEVGAMDNGSANATMLEVGRLLAQHKDSLYRGLRLAFWSGHSHGRYSGSTWYMDNNWEELYDRCVAHVNVDSTGARGATDYSHFLAHLELGNFGAAIVQEQTSQTSVPHRMSRAGDMSFNGVGIPALFMEMSQVPFTDEDTDYVSLATGKLLGSKMPWWWHTSEDTLDKIDLDVLVLDTKIYLATLWRLCHHPLLPMDFRPVAADIQKTLVELQAAVTDHLDLSETQARAGRLSELVNSLIEHIHEVAPDDAVRIQDLNRRMKRLSRILIPITYTAAGRFDHDPAWGMPHLPTLSAARELAQLPSSSDEYHFLRTRLIRNRNQVNWALRQAIAVLEG